MMGDASPKATKRVRSADGSATQSETALRGATADGCASCNSLAPRLEASSSSKALFMYRRCKECGCVFAFADDSSRGKVADAGEQP